MSEVARDPQSGIAIRFVKQWDLQPAFHQAVFSYDLFACGRVYVDDRAGAKRHAASGCKRCRRAVRRLAAILRRRAVGE